MPVIWLLILHKISVTYHMETTSALRYKYFDVLMEYLDQIVMYIVGSTPVLFFNSSLPSTSLPPPLSCPATRSLLLIVDFGSISFCLIILILQGRWDLEPEGDDSKPGCRLRVYTNVAFSKRTMWKGFNYVHHLTIWYLIQTQPTNR